MLPKEKLDQIEETLIMLMGEVKNYRKWYLDKEKRESEAKEMRANLESMGEPLYEEAKEIIISNQSASVTLLQRKLGIGYARAAMLIDILEERGIIGPAQDATPRKVLINKK